MTNLIRYASTLAACLLLFSCGLIPDERHFVNQGDVCLGGEGWPESERAITTDTAIPIVVFTACASSSCTKDRSANCTASLGTDGTIVVESKGRYVVNDVHPYNPIVFSGCTEDCSTEMNAHCEIPPLDAGQYTLVHGDHTMTFAVPTTEPPCW